jgi:uncharacterized membrane protein
LLGFGFLPLLTKHGAKQFTKRRLPVYVEISSIGAGLAMGKGRLEAFSDGVMAIIITIMVLELKAPDEVSWAALQALIPVFLGYVLSFLYLGIYWNNHHHLFQAVRQVNGRILWANLHLLFWLSLIPFTTAWIGENHLEALPVALYGVVLFGSALAYRILTYTLVSSHGEGSLLASAIGEDFKGKLSLVLYATAVLLSFVSSWSACALYTAVALLWLVPDQRIERILTS